MATADTVVSPIDEPLFEVVNGEKIEVPHMGAWASTIASWLAFCLNRVAVGKCRGLAVTEVMFRMGPDQPQRRPDVAFLLTPRWTREMMGPHDPPVYDTVPDIAVEIDSPTNTARNIENKVQEYLDAGVRLVWVIYPVSQRVHVFDSPAGSRILREGDTLDGGDVLPGFQLPLAELFSPPFQSRSE